MNVFWRELKAHKKSLIFWNLGMFFLVASGIAKFYGYTSTGSSSITEVLAMFPHSLQVLFGLNGFDLSTPGGVYGILFMYIIVTAAIHAVLLGTDLLSKEERDKTADFIFSKPVSRAAVVTEKLLAGLVNIAVVNLMTLVASIYFIAYFSKSSAGTGDVLLMDAALFITQLIFFFVGTAVAAVSRKPKRAAGVATAVLLISFVLYFAINLSGHIDFLSYLTPFKYFDAHNLLHDHSLSAIYVVLSAVITLTAIVITYGAYKRRDLSS